MEKKRADKVDKTVAKIAQAPRQHCRVTDDAKLDADQERAATLLDGPVLIIAGPGSGKTRTLTHRLANLVLKHQIPANQCLAITFTRRAAAEMQERLKRLLPDVWQDLAVHTFHSLGLNILREHHTEAGLQDGFRLAHEFERLAILRSGLELSERQVKRLLREISQAKRSPSTTVPSDVAQQLAYYQRELDLRNLVDYDDLIVRTVQLLTANSMIQTGYQDRFAWISVDEYQDIDEQQYRLIRLLTSKENNLCVVGDANQAIYSFRGADLSFFSRFQQDFPKAAVVQLKKNYRSSEIIVKASGQIVADKELPVPKTMQGDRITIHEAATDRAEAEFVVCTLEKLLGGHTFFSIDSGRSTDTTSDLSFADIAILYRTERQADLLCEALDRSGMPYQRCGHDRLSDMPCASKLLQIIMEQEGEVDVAKLLVAAHKQLNNEYAEDRETLDRLELVVEQLTPLAKKYGGDRHAFCNAVAMNNQMDGWQAKAERISLLTLHAAKGLEFRTVFIVGCEEGILPLRFGDKPCENLAEERRLLYVGITRAQERLFLLWSRRRRWFGRLREMTRSPFLDDVEEKLLQHSRTKQKKPTGLPDTQLSIFR